jgi:hypothetical protein
LPPVELPVFDVDEVEVPELLEESEDEPDDEVVADSFDFVPASFVPESFVPESFASDDADDSLDFPAPAPARLSVR